MIVLQVQPISLWCARNYQKYHEDIKRVTEQKNGSLAISTPKYAYMLIWLYSLPGSSYVR